MPQSGGCGPSHLSSALALVVDHDPQHALPEVLTSEAQTGDGAILYFQELRANYKNKTEGDRKCWFLWYTGSCQIPVIFKSNSQRLFLPNKTLPKQTENLCVYKACTRMRPKPYHAIEESLRNRTVINRATFCSKNVIANFPERINI